MLTGDLAVWAGAGLLLGTFVVALVTIALTLMEEPDR